MGRCQVWPSYIAPLPSGHTKHGAPRTYTQGFEAKYPPDQSTASNISQCSPCPSSTSCSHDQPHAYAQAVMAMATNKCNWRGAPLRCVAHVNHDALRAHPMWARPLATTPPPPALMRCMLAHSQDQRTCLTSYSVPICNPCRGVAWPTYKRVWSQRNCGRR